MAPATTRTPGRGDTVGPYCSVFWEQCRTSVLAGEQAHTRTHQPCDHLGEGQLCQLEASPKTPHLEANILPSPLLLAFSSKIGISPSTLFSPRELFPKFSWDSSRSPPSSFCPPVLRSGRSTHIFLLRRRRWGAAGASWLQALPQSLR